MVFRSRKFKSGNSKARKWEPSGRHGRKGKKELYLMNTKIIIAFGLAMALSSAGLASKESMSDQDLEDLARARAVLEQGRSDQAVELLEPLYQNYPQNAEVTNNLAVALFNNGQAAEAGIVLQTYLQTHTEVGVASNNLFQVYDFLAAESYSILSGSMPEKPKLALVSSDSEQNVQEIQEAPAEPAVTLRAATTDSDTQVAEIEKRLQGYIAAWSNGNADGYLSFYFPNRSPVRGQGFDRWKQERLEKIFPERNISVSVDELQIMPIDDSQAIAVYRQQYRARNYRDETTKQLTWLKQDGEWYIRYEAALPN